VERFDWGKYAESGRLYSAEWEGRKTGCVLAGKKGGRSLKEGGGEKDKEIGRGNKRGGKKMREEKVK